MKIYKSLFSSVAVASILVLATACTGDLDVTPIDPNLNTPDKALAEEANYNQLLAKCYVGLAVSSPDGPSGDADISGIDGGFGQYLRALYNLQELPTDEAVVGWNDQTLKDLHGLKWGTSDVFVTAGYSRFFYEISICNEVIRQIDGSGISSEKMTQYRNEARAIRALAYYHAIDLFGNVPFITEANGVGSNPTQISRADLFKWLTEEEIPAFMDQLPANPENYRAGRGLAYAIMAKLYLNAKVYTGTAMYDKCAEYCQKIIDLGYQLTPAAEMRNMFCASNSEYQGIGKEIIFSVWQDAKNCQGYGGTTYLIWAAVGGEMEPADYGMTGDGWGGLRVTPEFVDKFNENDPRATFFTEGQDKDINDIGTFTAGYAFPKFNTLQKDGTQSADNAQYSFSSTDFPVFRLADIYLMLAECQVVGGVSVNINGKSGIDYYNEVRARAGQTTSASISAQNIIDERARELAWECHRRSDLVRFDMLTTSSYVWQWKGGTHDGNSVASHFNLFPIPAADITSNTNLKQNPGY